jgi:hypothetical protein
VWYCLKGTNKQNTVVTFWLIEGIQSNDRATPPQRRDAVVTDYRSTNSESINVIAMD